MRKHGGSRGGRRSANWTRATPQTKQQQPMLLTHPDSSQACTHTPIGREVDEEALRRQGDPRRARRLWDSGGLRYPDRRRYGVSELAPPWRQD